MADLTNFPIPTEVLDPANYPELRGEQGPATEWQASATHLQQRPVGGDAWVDVVALADIQGQPGNSDVEMVASGDVTDLTLAPIVGLDRIYTARTTGAGTLTITAAAAGVYAACLLLLTSSANGTNVISVDGSPEWADGVAQTLAPLTGETLALYVQSISGTIHLTLASYS